MHYYFLTLLTLTTTAIANPFFEPKANDGYTSRLWGITLDTSVALDIVLANGSFIHATGTTHPDIYYALSGTADSFSTITTFHLQNQPSPASVVNWAYTLPGMYGSAAAPRAAFTHIQNFALNTSVVDGKLGFGVHLDGQSFPISRTYLGDLETFTNAMAPALLSGLPTPSSSSIQAVDWITSLSLLASPKHSPATNPRLNLHDDFFAKSLVAPSSAPLTTDALNGYFSYIIENSVNLPSPWFSTINHYGGPDSKINVPSPSSSAYSDRTALWVLQHYSDTTDTADPFPPGTLNFINELNTAITSAMPDTTFGAYLNYVDPSLTAVQAHNLYYGADTYAKLLAIKLVVDPGQVFWNPQSIGN